MPENENAKTSEFKGNSYEILDRYLGISDDSSSIEATPEQKKEMFEDWAKYLAEVQNPAKTANNPFTKANYSPLDEVLNSIRPVLTKYGFSMVQIPTYKESAVGIQTVIFHKSGGCFVFEKLSIPAKSDAQSVVAASTYARRAALNAICGVYGENDDDGNSTSGKSGKANKAPPAKPEVTELSTVIKNIISECTAKKNSGADVEALYKIIENHNNQERNPNTIKDLLTAKKILEEIKKI